jgi:hypothetical protein
VALAEEAQRTRLQAWRGAKNVSGSPNQVKAISANFEKREPEFGDVEN